MNEEWRESEKKVSVCRYVSEIVCVCMCLYVSVCRHVSEIVFVCVCV